MCSNVNSREMCNGKKTREKEWKRGEKEELRERGEPKFSNLEKRKLNREKIPGEE